MSVKFVIIGTNFVSDWFADAARDVPGAEVCAVLSRSASRGEEFAARHRIGKSFTDYDEMLRSEIDAVYIASPIYMHEEHAERAAARGKHLLVEKMMATDYGGALRMAEAARRAGVVLLEAMRPDFDPMMDWARENLHLIGSIGSADFSFCQYSSRYDKFKMGEVLPAFNPEIGNSALSDIGIYPLHTMLSMLGMPRSVRAEAAFLNNGFEGEGRLYLEYPGLTATVTYSKIRDSGEPSRIVGDKGELFIDKMSAPTRVGIILADGRQFVPDFQAPLMNMTCEISAFIDMVEGKRGADEYLGLTLSSIGIVTEAYRQTGADRFMRVLTKE